jgi:hypothetical protein
MLTYERKRLIFHQLVERLLKEGHFTFTKEERSVICFFFGWNISRLQAAVHCFSRQPHFGRAEKGVIKLQAAYKRSIWCLSFVKIMR